MNPGTLPVDAANDPAQSSRKTWIKPAVELLPRLSELTLQSPIPGGGGTGGGGSTVVP